GDDQERLGGDGAGDLDVVGFVIAAFVDRHAALTDAAAVKVGGDHDDRHGEVDARIDASQNEGLRAAAGFAGDGEARVVDVAEREQEVDAAHAVVRLQTERLAVVVGYLGRVAVADHVVGEDDAAHSRERGAAFL